MSLTDTPGLAADLARLEMDRDSSDIVFGNYELKFVQICFNTQHTPQN